MLDIILGIALIIIVFMVVKKVQDNSPAAKEQRQAGVDFLQKNAENKDYTVTASGLQIQCLSAGDGEDHPKSTDKVLVHYHGTLLDGSVFDSSVNRAEPISFGLNQVIKGWTEGLQLMVEGEKSRLVIPSELAYGNRATGGIPANSVLIFEVELLKINP